MIENIELIYDRIANAIIDEVPEEWEVATVTATFYPDGITWEPEVKTPTGELLSFDVSMELTRAFRELRRKFKDSNKPLWGQASFIFQSDGKFNIKWGYENCDKNGDTIWDEQEWQRQQDERRIRLTSE